MYYNTTTREWYATRAALPTSCTRADGSTINNPQSAPDAWLAESGIIPAIEDPTPDDMHRTGWSVEIVDAVAHRVPVGIPVADYVESVRREQGAQLQALVVAAGDRVRQLEGIVDFFGIPRPVSVETAIPTINAWIAEREAAEDWAAASRGGRMSSTLLALFSGLSDALEKQGIEDPETTINAVWQYMHATGQTKETRT